METKANYAIVGFFTIVVLLLAFGFVYWMSQYGREGQMERMIVRIPGSANGLSVGSPVRFNGIPIGSVRALDFDRKDPAFSLAVTEIRADSPVYPTTRAVLEVQGFTGAAYIELSGGNPADERILMTAGKKGEVAIILASQSSVTNIVATASAMLTRADKTLGTIQGFVNDNRKPLTDTISNVQVFSKSLKDNADGVDKFLESVSALSTTITRLSGRLDSTLASVESLLKAVDAKKIDAILANAQKVSGDIARASGNVDRIVADAGTTIRTINETLTTYKAFGDKAAVSLDRVDKLIAAIDPEKVQGSINDIRAALSDARTAINSFKAVSEDIDKRRNDIDKTITNVSQMSEKLNKASTRVDGVLAKVDSFLGSGDSSSLFADARETMKSFKAVADTINSRIGPIADNFSRFSGSGLKNIDALVDDARRAVNTLNSAVSRLDQDPQRLLFGGEEVKEYNGRVRR